MAFLYYEQCAEEKQQTVACIGQHHAEEKIVEKAHYRRRVDIVLAGHRVKLGQRRRRSGEFIVFECHRRLVWIGFLDYHRCGIVVLYIGF